MFHSLVKRILLPIACGLGLAAAHAQLIDINQEFNPSPVALNEGGGAAAP